MDLRLFWTALLAFFLSCTNDSRRPPNAREVPPDIWAQYKVWADEGDSLVTCLLQFYTNEQMSETMLLQPPSGVQVDGQTLAADSAGVVGAFYEYQAPITQFKGRHKVQFTDLDNRVFVDTFSFHPFTLAAGLPAVLSIKDHDLPLEGLPDGSAVRVVLTDTSRAGKGINELVRVKGGVLQLPAHFWRALHSGPIVMHLSAEEERPLNSDLPGSILVTYGMSRVVELRKNTTGAPAVRSEAGSQVQPVK